MIDVPGCTPSSALPLLLEPYLPHQPAHSFPIHLSPLPLQQGCNAPGTVCGPFGSQPPDRLFQGLLSRRHSRPGRVAETSGARFNNSARRRENTSGFSRYSRQTSAFVFSPVSSSNTTWALNSGVNFRRFAISSPFPKLDSTPTNGSVQSRGTTTHFSPYCFLPSLSSTISLVV